MPGREPDGIPWDERDDLSPREKEAIALYLEFSSEVQYYLRHPREIATRKEGSSFQSLLFHLDSAVGRSDVPAGRLLFRGVRDDFTRRLLFLLAVDPVACVDDGFHSITPHIIHDQGYTSFTGNAGRILPKTRHDLHAILVYQTQSSDKALYIGGKDTEMLYPRGSRWMATGFDCTDPGGTTLVLISLELFQGGL